MKSRPKPNSVRARAWRHTMMAAINAGLEQGLFGLRPGQNYWSDAVDKDSGRTSGRDHGGHTFEFSVAGVPGLAWVGDAGFDELVIHSVLWPNEEARKWIFCGNAHDAPIGGTVAVGWFERREGCYLQPSTSLFRCRSAYRPLAAALDVTPKGYLDMGRFRM